MTVFELVEKLTQMLASGEIVGSERVVMNAYPDDNTLRRVERCVDGDHEVHLEA